MGQKGFYRLIFWGAMQSVILSSTLYLSTEVYNDFQKHCRETQQDVGYLNPALDCSLDLKS